MHYIEIKETLYNINMTKQFVTSKVNKQLTSCGTTNQIFAVGTICLRTLEKVILNQLCNSLTLSTNSDKTRQMNLMSLVISNKQINSKGNIIKHMKHHYVHTYVCVIHIRTYVHKLQKLV